MQFNKKYRQKKTLLKEALIEVRLKGVEPPRLAALDPKSSVSTNSTTAAKLDCKYTQYL